MQQPELDATLIAQGVADQLTGRVLARDIETGERVVVGVNAFTGTEASPLLAADLSVGEIRDYLGVDSLAYLELDRVRRTRDELERRQQLLDQGIILEDTKGGVRWKRKA